MHATEHPFSFRRETGILATSQPAVQPMIVGIDLGTTHSLIGAYTAEGSVLFPNAQGQLLTPSAVSLDGDAVLVGNAARDRLLTHPDLSTANFKRLMGSDKEIRLGKRNFRAEELSSLVLRSLLDDAAAALGHPVTEAVISVPAYFSDAQRKATRIAGELAGINVQRLINEPTAAALAYGLQDKDQEGRVMVLDLGGGTFDVSLLELYDGVIEVHASAGDNFLGGEDFLDVLVNAYCKDHRLDPKRLAAQELAALRRQLEHLKRELDRADAASVDVHVEGKQRPWDITAERFQQLADPLLERMAAPIQRALADARMPAAALTDVIVVGGASRMPIITRMVTRMLGRLPLRHIHPDQAIAQGAAIAAGMKQRAENLEEVVLTDVCPYSLGTAVTRQGHNGQLQSGLFHPIIQRNSVVPVSREDVFHPVNTDQKCIRVRVYQGEHPLVEHNILLGELEVPFSTRAAEKDVSVRFTYDVDGLLQVEATENATGKKHELILQHTAGVLAPEQVKLRLQELSALKIHPREQQQVKALLARAERQYQEQIHARDMIQDWIVSFRTTLESQDLREIEKVSAALAAALDELESR